MTGRRARPISFLAAAALVGCSSSSSAPPQELPCDVDSALQASCRPCHSSPPAHGAPIPLMTFDDTRAPWTQPPTYDGTPTWKVMGDVIQANFMPQPLKGVSFTQAQRDAILSWVAAGAPPRAAGASCP